MRAAARAFRDERFPDLPQPVRLTIHDASPELLRGWAAEWVHADTRLNLEEWITHRCERWAEGCASNAWTNSVIMAELAQAERRRDDAEHDRNVRLREVRAQERANEIREKEIFMRTRRGDDADSRRVSLRLVVDNSAPLSDADMRADDPQFGAMTNDQLIAFVTDPTVGEDERGRRSRVSAWWLDQAGLVESESQSKPVFADIAAALAGGVTAPIPDGGPARTDGVKIFYKGKVHVLFGDPESGKTLVALAAIADALTGGECAAMVDTDHNGLAFVLNLLVAMGVSPDALISRFKFAEPDDREELIEAVDVIAKLDAATVVLDSYGENLTIWGVSANDDQGVIGVNRATAARLARMGHTVIVIDHMAKNVGSRNYGATGSTAKKRQVDGAMYEVVVVREFSPTDGGKNALLLRKDRNGGIRGLGYKTGETVAYFELLAPDPATGRQGWFLQPGTPGASGSVSPMTATAAAMAATALAIDIAELDKLNPPPKSKTDVQARTPIKNAARALAALQAWRANQPTAKP